MKIANTFAMIAALALASCGSSKVALKETSIVAPSKGDQLTQRVMELVNEHRVQNGREPVAHHAGLSKLAQSHCRYMKAHSGEFSLHGNLVTHFGFDGRATMANRKYRIENLGENVVASYRMSDDIAERVFNAWLQSGNHKDNLESNWAVSGIGAEYGDDGKVYVTQIFGSKPTMAQTVGAPTEW